MQEILRAEGVKDILNLTQHPLGRVNDSYAFCHHGGWYECSLETHALCVRQMLPEDQWAMFDFIECNFANLGTADAVNNQKCVSYTSLAYENVFKCATGVGPTSGPGMLLSSVELANSRGVHSAPTVFLNGVNVGFSLNLTQVCDAYTGPKPKGCTTAARVVQQAQPVPVCQA